MSRKKSEGRTERKRFSAEFKHQALLRAVRDGIPAVARDLGLEPAQLYAWRAKAQQLGEDAETQRLQQSETARLKREVARLRDEAQLQRQLPRFIAFVGPIHQQGDWAVLPIYPTQQFSTLGRIVRLTG